MIITLILVAMTISIAWSREDKNMIGTVEILQISTNLMIAAIKGRPISIKGQLKVPP